MAYKTKPESHCDMPAAHALRVLALNGSLKHRPDVSNTEEVAQSVIDNMGTSCQIHAEILRLADQKLPVGLGFREATDDDWPSIVEKIKAADIVLFATPVLVGRPFEPDAAGYRAARRTRRGVWEIQNELRSMERRLRWRCMSHKKHYVNLPRGLGMANHGARFT